MDEELNEHDLEERLYAMIHHVDESQANEKALPRENGPPVEPPRSTVRRYWRTTYNSTYQKANSPKDAAPPIKYTPAAVNKTLPASLATPASKTTEGTQKEKKIDAPESPPSELLILKNTVPQNYVKTVEILEIDEPTNVVELESSDEDEVIEVVLPPKPTITIESSDEEELIHKPNITASNKEKSNNSKENKSPNNSNRDVSASPVPSVVSNMSDEFIRGDCIALNISSAQPDNESFDFSLHGSDLLGDGIPSKKKKKKKSKDRLTSTPIAAEPKSELKKLDNIFATPKSKAKNKKQKSKSYAVSEKSIPNADVYDSDSNQSVIDTNKNHDVYVVTDKSFPSADVHESDSTVIKAVIERTEIPTDAKRRNEFVDTANSNMSVEISMVPEPKESSKNQTNKTLVIDLSNDLTAERTMINEDFVIGNVSGFKESEDYGDDNLNRSSAAPQELDKFCSTKVPQILYEGLDFDNLKGKGKVCKHRRYSLTNLRAEMDKFYNESWGGENFNHHEILKTMSRDKSLWVIDPRDRMANPPKRRVICNFCNRPGHRDDTCRFKPPVCYMCGHTGHYEPRCPRKICVNCGSPNFMYSMSCRNCAPWSRLLCAECGRPGHPASHCPDLWRRYHNAIDENMPLESCGVKPAAQQYCSGCARRGHLVHACRAPLPFLAPPPAPAVARYWRLYPPAPQPPQPPPPPPPPHKRHSKSPAAHEQHLNKKRTSESDDQNKTPRKPQKPDENKPRNDVEDAIEDTIRLAKEADEAPDFIPVASDDSHKGGPVLQDNEVSDTSEVVTSARLYAADDVLRRLRTAAGRDWLTRNCDEFQLDVQHSDSQPFLTIRGTVGDQEAFQSELRDWTRAAGDGAAANDPNASQEREGDAKLAYTMPQKKNDILRTLSNALEMLNHNIGDPRAMYKELVFLQNHHESLVLQRVVSPAKLTNNRNNMNAVTKKLNMVLLGQAGLAGGAEQLAALRAARARLGEVRQQRVPAALRDLISRNYQDIFTAAPRDDYHDLLKQFYLIQRRALAKKEKNKSCPLNKNQENPTKMNPSQGWKIAPLLEIAEGPEREGPTVETRVKMAMPIHVLKNKLMYYHKRLLHTHYADNARNQKRRELANKLQQQIRLLFNAQPSKKLRQKIRKSCTTSQAFLSDV